MKPAHLVVTGMLLISLIIIYFGMRSNGSIANNYDFPPQLSDLKIFKGKIQELVPNDNVYRLELSSTLFSDFAEKQRLIQLPKGTKLHHIDDGLPKFPDGTVLIKTFYYPDRLIETRVLLLKNDQWNAATYQWNPEQTEAFLITKGATVHVKQHDKPDIKYTIPSAAECVACHRHGETLQPIGPKIRNLNRMIVHDDQHVSQLDYLQNQQLLTKSKSKPIHIFPDYNDTSQPLESRARAYMDLNCAHCHHPNGMAGFTNLYLSYELSYKKTGIARQKQNIVFRMETGGAFHMPKLGTSVTDPNGLALIKAYIKRLED